MTVGVDWLLYFCVISRALLSEIEAYKTRMGWHFLWASSNGNNFNYDFNVSFQPFAMKTLRSTWSEAA